MIARFLIAASPALLLGGCGDASEVYPRPAADVRTVLLATDLPFPLQGTSHASVLARQTPEGAIELAIADRKGQAQLRFLAEVTDLGAAKTRVAVRFIGAGTTYPTVDKRIAEHPEIKAVYVKTMREQVDAQLDGRPFNNLAIGPEMMAAVALNAGSIAHDMQAAGEEFRRRDRENIEKAYAAEARGEW
jgi:hypothetical protein